MTDFSFALLLCVEAAHGFCPGGAPRCRWYAAFAAAYFALASVDAIVRMLLLLTKAAHEQRCARLAACCMSLCGGAAKLSAQAHLMRLPPTCGMRFSEKSGCI